MVLFLRKTQLVVRETVPNSPKTTSSLVGAQDNILYFPKDSNFKNMLGGSSTRSNDLTNPTPTVTCLKNRHLYLGRKKHPQP